MNANNLLANAKQGNSQAIAALINRHLQDKGMKTIANQDSTCLRLIIEGDSVPDRAALVPFLRNGIEKLQIAGLHTLEIYGRVKGSAKQAWYETVTLDVPDDVSESQSGQLETADEAGLVTELVDPCQDSLNQRSSQSAAPPSRKKAQPVPSTSTQKKVARVNVLSLAGAVVLFALPWTNIQCTGQTIGTQSGIQSIYGGVSTVDLGFSMEDLGNMGMPTEDVGQEATPNRPPIGFAVFVAIAFLLVLAGFRISIANLFQNKHLPVKPGHLTTLALAILILQLMVGLPIDLEVKKAGSELGGIATKRTHWFYLELVLMAIPTAMLAVNQSKSEEAG